jgi:Cu/Ag efflux protein CusF
MGAAESFGRRSGRPPGWTGRALVALSLGAVLACDDRRGGAVEVYRDVDGTVVSVEVERRILTVAHEDIPGLMDAMTMPLEVEDPALLDGLAPGHRVRLALRRIDGRLLVWAVDRPDKRAEEASPAARVGLLGGSS